MGPVLTAGDQEGNASVPGLETECMRATFGAFAE
jgi:hypothetical protein